MRLEKERFRRQQIKAGEVDAWGRVQIFIKHNWICAHCAGDCPSELIGTMHPYEPTLDHIKPLSKGGKHNYINLQLLCRKCNSSKSNKKKSKIKPLTEKEKRERRYEIKVFIAKKEWVAYGNDIEKFTEMYV